MFNMGIKIVKGLLWGLDERVLVFSEVFGI